MKGVVAAAIAVSATLGLVGCESASPPETITPTETIAIAAGDTKGNYYQAAIDLRDLLRERGYAFEIRETTGSIANLEAVGTGEADLGFSQLDTRLYLEQFGDDAQRESLDNTQLFAPVSNEVLHLMVRRDSGIEEAADLAGKRVAIGPPNSGTFVTAFVFYTLYGLDPETEPNLQRLDIETAVEGVLAGELDAAFFTSALGSPLLMELSAEAGEEIRLLALSERSRLEGLEGIYQPTTIPAKTYPWQSEAVPTFSTFSFIVVDRNLESQQVYRLAEAIYGKAEALQDKHSFWRLLGLEEATRDITISDLDYHEGVKEFVADSSE
ncbi:TRAP transporter solute receptor unknown substrate 1 [Geitlerinema sp. FC II]|nr:TAXI family TRAP transporter solute-binding subunit [Geitlerinema sp. CS-897]PPT06727.1 TRAP transporter solute receptor unknown substrate 1 [Geitlerinema sp. FC II]